MKRVKHKICIAALVSIVLVATGCIVSITEIIKEPLKFTAQTGFYFYQVNLTDNATWKENKDKIDFIDAVGVHLYITSTESVDVTFNAYVDDLSGAGSSPSSIPTTATKILDGVTISPGSTVITYAESLRLITGLDRLKALTKTGQFDFYGTSTGNDGNTFKIDSGYVIVTVSGG